MSPAEGSKESRTPLPPGWRWVRLGEVCDLVNGDAFRESEWCSSGIPIIRIQNLNDKNKPFNYWQGPTDRLIKIAPGDLLLAWSGTPGTSFGAHIWDRTPGVLNQHIFRVDLDRTKLVPDWVCIAINHQLGDLIMKAHGGVGLRHVTRPEVQSILIPFPPFAEQKRIAARLNQHIEVSQSARAAVRTELDAAKALPGAFLRIFYPIIAKDLPYGWQIKRVNDLVDLLPARLHPWDR